MSLDQLTRSNLKNDKLSSTQLETMGEVIVNVAQGIQQENTDYVQLGYIDEQEADEYGRLLPVKEPGACSIWWWIKVVLLGLCLLTLVASFFNWGMPFLIDKVIVPVLDWEALTFSTHTLVFVLIASIGLFPVFLLPSAPSMWLAGINFGYGFGFLIVMAGTSVGMSLPYFIGSLFHDRIQKWLERWPKKAAVIRLAGEGNWFHQFRAVALGRLLRELADMKYEYHHLTTLQNVYNTLGFCMAVGTTICITLYAKKALRTLQS